MIFIQSADFLLHSLVASINKQLRPLGAYNFKILVLPV